MTISTTTSKVGYNGNGVTTVFSVPFLFLANADLTVVLLSSAGVETTLTLSTHYTVTGAGNDSGGTLTMVTPPAVGERLTILREVALTQETDYISGDPFPAETHERALDRLTMIAQQLTEVVNRSLRFPVSDTAFPELPTQPSRASKFLAFDADGELSVASPTADSSAALRLDLAASGAGKGADLVNFDGKTITPDSVEAPGSNEFGTGFDQAHQFYGRITLGALNGPMSFGDLQYCGIQNFGRYNIDGNYAAIQHTTDDSCALFGFFKARGTQTTPLPVIANDDTGEVSFHGWNGTTFVKGAIMTPIVDGSPSGGFVPMRIRFWTMNASGVLKNAVDIDKDQKMWAYGGFDARWEVAGGSAIRAYYKDSTGGGAEIRTSNGYSTTVPVYSFWFNNTTGLGNPAENVISAIIGGAEKFRFDNNGHFVSTGSGVIGYGVGSGGTVTQATNKSTSVTLNRPSGQITMHNAALAAGSQVTFTLNSSTISATDVVTVMPASGFATWGAYQAWAGGSGTGQVGITLRNMTGGSLSEAVVLNFVVTKGATS